MTGGGKGNYEAVIETLQTISGWKDADEQIHACQRKIEEIKAKEEADRLESAHRAEEREKAAKKRKKIIAIITPIVVACIAFVIVLTTVIIPNKQYHEAIEKYSSALKDVSVGDIVKFGAYEQDNNVFNGKEEIEWVVLEKENDRILVISKYALNSKPYNTSDSSVTWETCSLRKWINGSFANSAFNAGERKMIVQTNVIPDGKWDGSSDYNTTDKVFLLGITEANKYFSSDEAKKCVPTEYAIAQGAYTSDDYSADGKATCGWWLRSRGYNSDMAIDVYRNGRIYDAGTDVEIGQNGVRPALWINL